MTLPYRDFYYPLNVFMHILTLEEGPPRYLHYGMFEESGEPIYRAQERSTEMLFARLPQPPARVLDVGSGLGTTLSSLAAAGYDATGITPDETQIALIRARHGDALSVRHRPFEAMTGEQFDTIVFQESSQYIPSNELFATARGLSSHLIVIDEFALRPVALEGALHALDEFLGAATAHGFRKIEELDVSEMAAPTVDYFTTRIPRHADELVAELGIAREQIASLLESGERYRQLYREGIYGYRVLQFRSD